MNTSRPSPIVRSQNKPFTITAEAKAMLEALEEVEKTSGKDARKARQLSISSRALLLKLTEVSSAVKFLLEGKVSSKV